MTRKGKARLVGRAPVLKGRFCCCRHIEVSTAPDERQRLRNNPGKGRGSGEQKKNTPLP